MNKTVPKASSAPCKGRYFPKKVIKIAAKKDKNVIAAKALADKLGWEETRTRNVSRMLVEREFTDPEDPETIRKQSEIEVKIKPWTKANPAQQLKDIEASGNHTVDGAPSRIYELMQNMQAESKGLNLPNCFAYNKVGGRTTLEKTSFFNLMHNIRTIGDNGEMAYLARGQYSVGGVKVSTAQNYDRLLFGGYCNSIDAWCMTGRASDDTADIDADEEEQGVF